MVVKLGGNSYLLPARALAVGALIPLLGACSPPIALPLPSHVQRQKNVTYACQASTPLLADVYYRPQVAAAPAILLIHGGSWKGDGSKWMMNGIARKLAKRGYVVVNATYRGLPENRYPVPVDDLRQAIRWMKVNAKTYGIDPRRIATFGYSAGGHLATMVALADGNPEGVRAIVAGSAPFDLTLYPGGDIIPRFLGGTQKEIPQLFHEASPVNQVKRDSPPIFIYHGTADNLVQPEHAVRMQAAYRKAGMNTEIHWMKGRAHLGALLWPGTKVDEAIDFLDGILKP